MYRHSVCENLYMGMCGLQITVRRRTFTRDARREALCWWRQHATAGCDLVGAYGLTSASSVVRPTSSRYWTDSVPAAASARCAFLTQRWTRRDRVWTTSPDTCPPPTCVCQVRLAAAVLPYRLPTTNHRWYKSSSRIRYTEQLIFRNDRTDFIDYIDDAKDLRFIQA